MSDNTAAQGEHLPDCPYAEPCPVEWRNDDWRRETGEVTPHRIVSGSSGRCVECGAGDCICDRLRLARDRGYGEAMDDGWGEPGHIKAAVRDERTRILKALRKIEGQLHWKDALAFVKIVEESDNADQ